jgi:uncharacterized membrane protein
MTYREFFKAHFLEGEMHAFRLSIALAVASCAFAPPAKADLTVCNRTPDQVTGAAAWVSPSGGSKSRPAQRNVRSA